MILLLLLLLLVLMVSMAALHRPDCPFQTIV
jgi:hypothetical protein